MVLHSEIMQKLCEHKTPVERRHKELEIERGRQSNSLKLCSLPLLPLWPEICLFISQQTSSLLCF